MHFGVEKLRVDNSQEPVQIVFQDQAVTKNYYCKSKEPGNTLDKHFMRGLEGLFNSLINSIHFIFSMWHRRKSCSYRSTQPRILLQ